MTDVSLSVVYDETGAIRAVRIDGHPYTPAELARLLESQAEADALRAGRAGLLRRIAELESKRKEPT